MAAEGDLQLPLGFRFHPTDEELVMHYLLRKCASLSIAAPVIAEVDLYKYNAWDLPGLASYGEKEWYFFSPRDRKYPNGSRPNRVAGTGYWKATGADKPIGSPKPAGIKKALVFYSGKSPGGEKTNWIMHEYRLANVDRSGSKKKKKSIRLDDWVLCRIYHKKGIITETGKKMIDAVIEDENIQTIIPRLVPETSSVVSNDFMYLDASDSVPRIPTDSSCSEHELSPEVESAAPKMAEWEGSALDFPFDYINGGAGAGSPLISSQFDKSFQVESMQELF